MEIKVGNKKLNIKKWKGKNKKDFIRLVNDSDTDNQKLLDILVYSCIEEDVILSTEEFRYVLTRIRAYSLGETISFEFYCDKCQEIFHREMKLIDIIRYTYKPLKEIKFDKTKIKLGEIKNKEIYTEKVSEDPDYDFLFRIESINGNDTFTLTELMDIIDNFDIDVIEKVMEIYEDHRFKVDDTNIVKCDCGHEMIFQFDELPGFFPEKWFDSEE